MSKQVWVPVVKLEWDCPCSSCRDNDPTSWHWHGEYNTYGLELPGTVYIIDKDDYSNYRAIALPPGYALCKLTEVDE